MAPQKKVHLQACMTLFKVDQGMFDEIRRYIHNEITPSLLLFGPLRGQKYEHWLRQNVFPKIKSRFGNIFKDSCFSNPHTKHAMHIRRLLMLEKQYYRRKAKLTK